MTKLGEEIEKARKGGCTHAIPCKVDMDGVPTCVAKHLGEVDPEDEFRTISWVVLLDGRWRHMTVRFHLPKPKPGEEPMSIIMRTAAPKVTIDGESTLNLGHFAIYRKYLSDFQIKEQYEAVKNTLQ